MPYLIFKEVTFSRNVTHYKEVHQNIDNFVTQLSTAYLIPENEFLAVEARRKNAIGFGKDEGTYSDYAAQYCGFTKGLSKTIIIYSNVDLPSDSLLIQQKGKDYIGTIPDSADQALSAQVKAHFSLNQLNEAEIALSKQFGYWSKSQRQYICDLKLNEIDSLIANIQQRKIILKQQITSYKKLYIRGY